MGVIMFRNPKNIKFNRFIILSILILFCGIIIFIITDSYANDVIIEKVILKSNNLNYDSQEEGSWKVEKSAKWVSKNKVQITFDVDTISKNSSDLDLVIVVDDAIDSTRRNIVKNNINELISSVLSNSNNRVALMSFSDSTSLLVDFTSDVNALSNKVLDSDSNGFRSYYKGLFGIETLLNNYNENDRSLVALFITDGLPNLDIYSAKVEYEYLKDRYNNFIINAISIDNSIVKEELKLISDYQYICNNDNMLDVLKEASSTSLKYEEFRIIDVVSEYFRIDKVSSDYGNIDITDNTIEWVLNDLLKSGFKKSLVIDVSLLNDYSNVLQLYKTNDSEKVISSINSIKDDVYSTSTPVITNGYMALYDGNAPFGCSVSNVPTSQRELIFDTVMISEEIPKCEGYIFKKWEVVTDNVKTSNNSFIMPSKDVVLKAVWVQGSLNISMNSNVSSRKSLYDLVSNEALSLNLVKKYEGKHQDTVLGNGNKDIYYYYADNDIVANSILDKNNVIFADMCWQMIRTTDNGSIKMLYNGEAVNGRCDTNRVNHVGYNGYSIVSLSGTYYYSTDYTYDSNTKLFSLSGTKTSSRWGSLTAKNLIGKYTCVSSDADGTCSTLYYIESSNGLLTGNALLLNGDSFYSQFGTMNFNNASNSLAYVSYMYNSSYTPSSNTYGSSDTSEQVLKHDGLKEKYYFSDTVSWNSSKKEWSLVNPYRVSSEAEFSSVIGKYTFGKTSSSHTDSVVQFVSNVDDNNDYYYIELEDGNDISTYLHTYTYGDTYIDNSDGTYTITNPSTFDISEWDNNYKNIEHKYVCIDASNNSCSNIRYITSTTSSSMHFYDSNTMGMKFSSTISYDNGIYKLDGDVYTLWDFHDADSINKLGNGHYTCFDKTGECSSVSYVYYADNSKILDRQHLYYINLINGDTIDDALKKMIGTNSINSIMKTALEAWYEKYLLNYSDYLDDVIYCNNRSFLNVSGWTSTKGNVASNLKFGVDNNLLFCENVNDRFSISNDIAKVNYPVGLISSQELMLLNNSLLRSVGSVYATMSPASFTETSAYIYSVSSDGSIVENLSSMGMGIRPYITLKGDLTYSIGDGSRNNPYVIEKK